MVCEPGTASLQEAILTIAIPTFKRACKLRRLLILLQEEITRCGLQKHVVVLISDNASPDDTQSVVSQFANVDFFLRYYRQSKNLGFDGNLRFLYRHANTLYVWYLADDDLPCRDAVSKILDALRTYIPDVLLFSFVQPPGSTLRQFDYLEPVHLVSEPVKVIEHVLRYTKISIFVMRKVIFDDLQWRNLDENLNAGWYYISLAFSVLEASQNLRLAIISEPLAMCDDDYYIIAYSPISLFHMEKAVQHSFVLKYNPKLLKSYRDIGYYQAIQFSFAGKTGGLLPERQIEYDEFIKDLEWRISTLLRHPRSLFQLMALKLRIAGLWPYIRLIVRLKR